MFRSVQLMAVLCSVYLGTTLSAAVAAEFRSRPPHIHGQATLDIAIEGPALGITFRAPAINVLGFEHAPATPAEVSSVASAQATFQAGDRLFLTPAKASCAQKSARFTPITYETEGDDDKPDAPQADYEVTYEFVCARPAELTSIDTTLFESLRNAEKITVNIVAQNLQTQRALTPPEQHIALRAE